MLYEEEISLIRRKLIYQETNSLGHLDLDGDNEITLKDLWLWKSKNRFRIKVNTSGGNDGDVEILKMAAKRWEQIITHKTSTNEYDLIINVTFDPSLPENVLGQAGVTDWKMHEGKYVPTEGIMILSSKNWSEQINSYKSNGLTNGYYTVLHEFGHILGIGTMWSMNDLLNPGGNYIGEHALREYRNLISDQDAPYLPVEDDGGSGTARYHPEEGLEPLVSEDDRVAYKDGVAHSLPGLDKELMTGWAELSTDPEPLSRVSVAMLHDIGFSVDYEMADEYRIFNIDGSKNQNDTTNMFEKDEILQISFQENEREFSTQIKCADSYLNRMTFDLYLADEQRYMRPSGITLKITNGTVRLDSVYVVYMGSSEVNKIQLEHDDRNVGDTQKFFPIKTIQGVSKLTLVFS